MLTRFLNASQRTNILIAISLIVLFVSCGNNGNSTPGTTSFTPTEKSNDSGKQEITFRVGNLLIRSTGIHCEIHEPLRLPSDGGNLVLTTDRLKYDSAELQQMQAYAQAYYNNT